MKIFALILAFAAFAIAVPADISCGLEIGCGDVQSRIALSDAPPTTVIAQSGVIQVFDSNDKSLGYISKHLSGNGHSRFDPSIENALIGTFTSDRAGTGFSTKLDLTVINLNSTYPFLGLIQGRDNKDSDLEPDSYQYLYIGGISAPGTQPGAPPSKIGNSHNDGFMINNRTAESAVWTYDATSSVLTPQWINTDGSSPHEELFIQKDILYISGSKGAFHARYHASPVTTIKFKFVSTEIF